MIIEEISQQDLLNASSTQQIWGVTMSPRCLINVSLPINSSFNSLHITKAVLRDFTKENKGKNVRSLVYMNCGGEYILFCSLTTNDCESCDLSMPFHGTQDLEFWVTGPREVSLSGYLYNCKSSPSNVITPPIITTTEIVDEGEKRKETKKDLPIVDGSDARKLGNNGGEKKKKKKHHSKLVGVEGDTNEGPVGGTSKTTKTQTNDDKEKLYGAVCALPTFNQH